MTTVSAHHPAGHAIVSTPPVEEPSTFPSQGEGGLSDRCLANLALLYGRPRTLRENARAMLAPARA